MQAAFRLGTSAEVESFLPLIHAFYAVDRHEYDEARIRPALMLLLAEPRYGHAWFIEVNSEVVGYMVVTYGFALESGGREMLIDEFYIDTAHRGQGIGRQAVEFLRQQCRTEAIQVLYLEVERHNTAAFAFYQRMGFVPDDSTFMTMRIAG